MSAKKKMKWWKKLLIILIMIPVVFTVLLTVIYIYMDNKSDIAKGYYNKIETGGELEKSYLQPGEFEISKETFKAEDPVKKISVFFPKEMKENDKSYPMILVINGTGGKCTKSEPMFELYASHGFIVVGTQDKNTGTGQTTIDVLNKMLQWNEDQDSVFYHKIDTENIGVTGFSQGGAAVFNVITKYEEAAKAFVGENPEILSNTCYQDQRINLE